MRHFCALEGREKWMGAPLDKLHTTDAYYKLLSVRRLQELIKQLE